MYYKKQRRQFVKEYLKRIKKRSGPALEAFRKEFTKEERKAYVARHGKDFADRFRIDGVSEDAAEIIAAIDWFKANATLYGG